MRRGFAFGCALVHVLVVGGFFMGAGAVHAQPQPGPPPKVQTTPEANRESLQSAAQAPLRDLNVVRTKIPPVLLDAMSDPYRRPQSHRCSELVALLAPLDDALGADLDTPSTDQDDLLEKGKAGALTVAASAASSVIPFRGWVRQLSGAEQHDRTVQAAITAGAVRRGYLKGLGEARGCNPPATPSHQKTPDLTVQPASPQPSDGTAASPRGGMFAPRYSIRPPAGPSAPSGTPAGTPPADPPR